jgi:N-acetylneuraminic acid mutarotase
LQTGQAGAAAALVGDNIYTMGTYGGSSICQIYDIGTESWQSGPDIPRELYWSTAEAVGNSIYLIGGWEPWGQGDLNTLYILDALSNTWTQGANLPSAIQITASAVYDNQIYVFGQGVYYQYDIVTDSWDVFPAPPSGRGYAAEAVTVGDKIYLIGGNSGSVNEAFKSVEIYNPVNQT